MARLLLMALVAAGLAYGLYWLFRPRRLFLLRVTAGGGVDVRGQVPGRRLPDVVEFVTSLRLKPGGRIEGLPSPEPRGFRLRISDDVPMGVQQQLRNYLYLKN
jgi:hypothetical protein